MLKTFFIHNDTTVGHEVNPGLPTTVMVSLPTPIELVSWTGGLFSSEIASIACCDGTLLGRVTQHHYLFLCAVSFLFCVTEKRCF